MSDERLAVARVEYYFVVGLMAAAALMEGIPRFAVVTFYETVELFEAGHCSRELY